MSFSFLFSLMFFSFLSLRKSVHSVVPAFCCSVISIDSVSQNSKVHCVLSCNTVAPRYNEVPWYPKKISL